MSRLLKKRPAALVMAVLVGMTLTFSSISAPAAWAAGPAKIDIGDGSIGGGGHSGDPDVPTGPTRGTSGTNAVGSAVVVSSGGDGSSAKSILMLRIQVALQLFRITFQI